MYSSEKYGGWLEKDKLLKRDISCFNFYSTQYLKRKDDKSFKRDIIVLISFLTLFVSIYFLVTIGTEMSLPRFRTKAMR